MTLIFFHDWDGSETVLSRNYPFDMGGTILEDLQNTIHLVVEKLSGPFQQSR